MECVGNTGDQTWKQREREALDALVAERVAGFPPVSAMTPEKRARLELLFSRLRDRV